MVTRLQVIYRHTEVDSELDEQIEKFFKSIGFKRWASGYDLLSSERDLAFERVTEEGEHESQRDTETKLKT